MLRFGVAVVFVFVLICFGYMAILLCFAFCFDYNQAPKQSTSQPRNSLKPLYRRINKTTTVAFVAHDFDNFAPSLYIHINMSEG